MSKRDKAKLKDWQDKLERAENAYSAELVRMDKREELYSGSKKIDKLTPESKINSTPYIRNIVSELIEAQIDSSIPSPKVTALRKQDEDLARKIETMLNNEIDRLPVERINDMMARTVPIQGAGFYLLEWDETQKTHTTSGELCLTPLHPKMVIPQDGVTTGIEDMDYIFVKIPQTKAYIAARYGVNVKDEAEDEPGIRNVDERSAADDMVTQVIAYYRNKNGGIGLFSWVNDTVLEDIDDYQARRRKVCAVCGAEEPSDDITPIDTPTLDGTIPDGTAKQDGKKVCPYCGSDKWEFTAEDTEKVFQPIKRSGGRPPIPGATMEAIPTGDVDEFGIPLTMTQPIPMEIPLYKPDRFPIIEQVNISAFGRFIGESDVDKVETHQNIIKRIDAKIIDKLCSAGSYVTLPPNASIRVDDNEMKVIRVSNPADIALIGVHTVEADISQDIAYRAEVYENARQLLGITDAYQGRKDTSAKSGVAKEFAANQSAGRLESKRVAKLAAYADLFEAMFKFKLAYADEPRPVVDYSAQGKAEYGEFNRYDFLEQDEAGEWFWNDRFLFSADSSGALGQNREAMWRETTASFQVGAFGNPGELDTQILYWRKMEDFHYPAAAETKAALEARRQQVLQMQLQQQIVADAQSQLDTARAATQQAAQNNFIPPEGGV